MAMADYSGTLELNPDPAVASEFNDATVITVFPELDLAIVDIGLPQDHTSQEVTPVTKKKISYLLREFQLQRIVLKEAGDLFL